MFYDETESVLASVKRSIEEYREQVYEYMDTNKTQLMDPMVAE
jgi:hypothetical protein